MASTQQQTLSAVRRTFILGLCITVFLAENINNTLPSPFFPTEAETRGISQTMVGIIIAAFNVFVCISAILMLVIASPTKMKVWFCVGAVLSGATCFIFGELIRGPPGTAFAVMCIITRALMGCAASAIWGSGSPLILPLFPKWEGRVMSLIEFTGGVGLLVGPPIASLFYKLGGYSLPFMVIGAVEMSLAVICFLVLPTEVITTTSDSSRSFTSRPHSQSVALKFIKNPGILITSLPLFMNTAFIGFTMTAFSPFLFTDFGIKQDIAGFYFIPYSLVSTIGTFIMGGLVDKGYGEILYDCGAIGSTASFFILFLPIVIPTLRDIFFLEVSFFLSGLSFAAVLTPALLLFVKVGQRNRIASSNQLKVFSACWTTFTIASGQIYGQAFIGGIFFQNFGFYNSCLLQAVVSAASTIGLLVYKLQNGVSWLQDANDDNDSVLCPLVEVDIKLNDRKFSKG